MEKTTQRQMTLFADLCVIGGGLAGVCAALAAARGGAKVVLMQDRPVLGGNSSSEIRMWVRGAHGPFNREGGILAELEEENIYANPTLVPTLWDATLWGKVKAEKNITLLLNCTCMSAESTGTHIESVTGWQLTTYSFITVKARLFADCSGDSILAYLTAAKHRAGREAKSEFGEAFGPETADRMTMGMSCLLQARETDHPVSFRAPAWAYRYNDEGFATVSNSKYSLFRDHTIGTDGCNLWWIELGGDSGDPTAAAENTRDELLKTALGIWDHIKNRGDHHAENWELEWVGFLPGKRESIRYEGAYIMTEKDVTAGGHFADTVAFGGWKLDDHNPKGFLARGNDAPPSHTYPAPSPYGIPYRVLYSANIDNLFFAGRNISVTHAALSSTRVMATCALLGQAAGTAAALCVKYDKTPDGVGKDHIDELQQRLLDAGMFLPDHKRRMPALTKKAALDLSDEARAVLQNGVERPREAARENGIVLPIGGAITFALPAPARVGTLRIAFDPDYERGTVSPNRKMRVFAQKLHEGLDFVPVKVPATIVKTFTVYADGAAVYHTTENHNSLVHIPLDKICREVRVAFEETNGAADVVLFACDIAE